MADVKSLPGVRDMVRLRPREGEHHLALAHWILSSRSFAVKTLRKDEVYFQINTQTRMSLAHLLTVCFFNSSSQIFLNWLKVRRSLPLCQISCLSWNTLIRWTPGSRRPGQAEMFSMHFTEAAWRIFTLLFTTGCTVTWTRLMQSAVCTAQTLVWHQQEVTYSIPLTFCMTLTTLLVL